ncbi:hypothetical protein [Streptomyces sp. R41]|uniref:Tetracyclin repressor-like C-terminal domain-containing protein n=1 Tax=Streptomyces sp. R41 TaxID=3238632 RepID=A0AB39RQM3_9ACTN
MARYVGWRSRGDGVGGAGTSAASDVSVALLEESATARARSLGVGSDGARAIVGEIVGHLAPEDPKPARGKALGLFAMMAGSLQLSRVAFGSKLADEVLENALAFMC